MKKASPGLTAPIKYLQECNHDWKAIKHWHPRTGFWSALRCWKCGMER